MLSNIVLNELDHKLEARDLGYCRWADDFVIVVRSERAAHRVMKGTTAYLEDELGLPVNRQKSRVASIKDIPARKRWDDVRWNVGGNLWSLNQIEHEQIRPKFSEPRIHFALVCAAVGCPPLRNEAYTGDRLEAQLEAQTRLVHRDGRWFRYDRDRNTVHLTKLYEWYGGDFKQAAGSVPRYVAAYSPQLKEAVDAGRPPNVRWLDYDWSLNEQKPRGR